MLHIILGILKIVGIILVTIIGILLLVLLLILFFPVSYQIKGEKDQDITGNVKVSWLFHLIAFYVTFENNARSTKLKILGIPIRFDKIKKEKPEKKKKSKLDAGTLPVTIKLPSTNNEEDKYKENDEENDEEIVHENPRIQKLQEIEITTEKNEKENLIIGFIRKLIKIIKGIYAGIKNIKFTLERIYDRIIAIKSFANQILDFLKDENNQAGFHTVKIQLLRLWRHMKPKKYKLDMNFGTGDPASTGQLLGVMSFTYPVFKNNLKIMPDFEKQILEGNFFLKGRIQVYMLVWIAISLYREKNIKSMLDQLQKLRRK